MLKVTEGCPCYYSHQVEGSSTYPFLFPCTLGDFYRELAVLSTVLGQPGHCTGPCELRLLWDLGWKVLMLATATVQGVRTEPSAELGTGRVRTGCRGSLWE